MLKEFLKDQNGFYSSMRLSYLICMFLSIILVITSIFAIFLNKDISHLLNTAISFAAIGTSGKVIQNNFENKNKNGD